MTDHPSLHHLSDSDLIAYIHHQSTPAQRKQTDQHLETCLNCRRRLLDHADFRRRLDTGLSQGLSRVAPVTGWTDIEPQLGNSAIGHKRVSQRPETKARSRRVLFLAIAAVYAVVLVGGGFVVFTLSRNTVREQQNVSLVDDRSTATSSPTPVLIGASVTPAPTTNTPEPMPTISGPPVWDGEGRVNLLLLGIDQRGEQEGYWRTDTMIIVTIDPAAQTVGMISVPRDLWVPIWGYDMQNRINTAHYFGDARGYPGGGPALARDTIAYNLGIPIHHYVRLNFTAFESLIDEIGGIDIYVEKTINDAQYPDEGTGYDPFYLPAGQHHLDGRTALKYARSRHGTGDFDRAQRQQQVILAARNQVVKLNQLPRLIANAPEILNTLGNSVKTDLSLELSMQLAQILNNIPPESFRGAVIDRNYTVPYTTDTGAQVLIPLRDKIATLYESFFKDQ
jgi:LCP family protein required for cell wall assembly